MSNKSGAISGDAVTALAARALASGDPLGALNFVALQNDALALALRGIAMAQLGDLVRAKALLKSAARAFGPSDAVARARCIVAEAEIGLATRDIGAPSRELDEAMATLDRHADLLNFAHARFIAARRLLLVGRPSEAERIVAKIEPRYFPPALRAGYELVVAGIAFRRLHASEARAALDRADRAARAAGIASLVAEVRSALSALNAPAARLVGAGESGTLIGYDEVESILASGALVVDACHGAIRSAEIAVSLASRPLLFELACALGQVWPEDRPRSVLIERAFQMSIDDEDDRLRLRVEIGRLRAEIEPLAAVVATKRGFALVPHTAHRVVVLMPPAVEKHASVLTVLADGESWTSSALALALGVSQRSVQRALEALQESRKVASIGRGRACRWMATPIIGFPSILLLAGSLPGE